MDIQRSLGYLLNTSARFMKHALNAKLRSCDITTAQWAVLKLLSTEKDLSQAEIAEKLSADRATGSAVIDKLIAKGLLQKELSEADHRSYRVKNLPAAAEVVREATLWAEEINAQAVRGLSDEKIAIFKECLLTICKNMEGNKNGMDA